MLRHRVKRLVFCGLLVLSTSARTMAYSFHDIDDPTLPRTQKSGGRIAFRHNGAWEIYDERRGNVKIVGLKPGGWNDFAWEIPPCTEERNQFVFVAALWGKQPCSEIVNLYRNVSRVTLAEGVAEGFRFRRGTFSPYETQIKTRTSPEDLLELIRSYHRDGKLPRVWKGTERQLRTWHDTDWWGVRPATVLAVARLIAGSDPSVGTMMLIRCKAERPYTSWVGFSVGPRPAASPPSLNILLRYSGTDSAKNRPVETTFHCLSGKN